MFRIDELQACEPEALDWEAGVQIDFADELDSMGFDRVSIAAETPGELVAFLGTHWGRSDPRWFAETLQTMYGFDVSDDDDGAPAGYREIRFVSGEESGRGQVWRGIRREDDGAYVYPYVSRGTARAIAAELHSSFPTCWDAHKHGLAWFEVDVLFDGTHEFVMYEAPPEAPVTAYDGNGYPEDADAWGTSNLLDDASYAEAFPTLGDENGRDFVDLGALGLVWVELREGAKLS